MSSAWTKAVLGNRAAACESPIAANHPISPVVAQRMISQARLKISHAPRSAPSVTGKANTRKHNKIRVFVPVPTLVHDQRFSTLLEFFS